MERFRALPRLSGASCPLFFPLVRSSDSVLCSQLLTIERFSRATQQISRKKISHKDDFDNSVKMETCANDLRMILTFTWFSFFVLFGNVSFPFSSIRDDIKPVNLKHGYPFPISIESEQSYSVNCKPRIHKWFIQTSVIPTLLMKTCTLPLANHITCSNA